METVNKCKVYVDVGAEFKAHGCMCPRRVRWTDGHVYKIMKKITDGLWKQSSCAEERS